MVGRAGRARRRVAGSMKGNHDAVIEDRTGMEWDGRCERGQAGGRGREGAGKEDSKRRSSQRQGKAKRKGTDPVTVRANR